MTTLVLGTSFFALFVLITKIQLADISVFNEIWAAVTFTLLQAFLSAALAVFLGLVAAPGYAGLSKGRRFMRMILLIPNLMSPILVILCLLLSFSNFPFGLLGILIAHVFMNFGLATISLGEAWRALEGRWHSVGQVLGAPSRYFTLKVLLPLIGPQIRNTFAIIFSFCLASFAIPLVLGGGPQFSTLEVLAYEKIFAQASLSQATLIALVQVVLQFLVFVFIVKSTSYSDDPVSHFVKRSPWGILFLGLLPLLPISKLAWVGAGNLNFLTDEGFWKAALQSLAVALLVGVSVIALMVLSCVWRYKAFALSFPSLSGVVVGLGILVYSKFSHFESFIVFVLVIAFGHLSVMLLPLLRLSHSATESIRLRYSKVLKLTRAPLGMSLKGVYWPLGKTTFLTSGILACCWSMGEFSVSKLLAPAQATLPLYIQSLLGSYQLEAAASSSLILFLFSFIAASMLEAVGNGFR